MIPWSRVPLPAGSSPHSGPAGVEFVATIFVRIAEAVSESAPFSVPNVAMGTNRSHEPRTPSSGGRDTDPRRKKRKTFISRSRTTK